MKRKISLLLLALFACSAFGIGTAIVHIQTTTRELNRLLSLHKVEELRKDLIVSIQTTQANLYTVHTNLAQNLDIISENVMRLDRASEACVGCHHVPDVEKKLVELQQLVNDYEEDLSYYITSASAHDMESLKLDAAKTGNRLLGLTEEMSVQATRKLEVMTTEAMRKIDKARMILYGSILLTFAAGLAVAVNLSRSVTGPVEKILLATRAITLGELGATVDYRQRNEFGELATNFNLMSIALKDGYARLENEITERKHAEGAIRHSEEFLNNVFNSIRDPFCVFDREGRIVRVNEAYAEMKRMLMPDLIGRTCVETYANPQELCHVCIVQKTFQSCDASATEKMLFSSEGVPQWFEIYTYPILGQDGRASHVIEYIRDITERKLTEEALRESQEQYALAARGANDGLWDWDLRKNLIYFSPRWKSMLGYDDSEVGSSAEDWFGRLHPDDRDEVNARVTSHVDGLLEHFDCEYRIRNRSGEYLWMLARGLAVRDSFGKAYRIAGSQTDITARKRAEEQLLYDAFHDALTGLPNRALFSDRLQQAINRSNAQLRRGSDYAYSVFFLDIDRFKVINDSMGHQVGDKLLVDVGTRLAACVRPGDTVARFGGDEYAILLEQAKDVEAVLHVAARILEEFRQPFLINGQEILSTVSIGIALGSSRYGKSEQLLRDADIAMYQAKAKGKARHEIYDSSMHAGIVERLKLEADLRLAVERAEFVMHYQPIMDLTHDLLIGFEALVRWQHPVRGMIYPMEFIPLAEEIGLISPLGEWILDVSCMQLAEWQKTMPALKMSINISGKQFARPDLADTVVAVLQRHSVKPETLAIEITESIIMEHSEIAVETLFRLRNMGVHIHIDDFGTGYSSLSYINRFPVTALKIDRSFIKEINANPENLEIVKAIVALAQSLNLDVIAEGLELDHQISQIKDLNCRYGQGYFFSRPMDPSAVNAWIKTTSQARELG